MVQIHYSLLALNSLGLAFGSTGVLVHVHTHVCTCEGLPLRQSPSQGPRTLHVHTHVYVYLAYWPKDQGPSRVRVQVHVHVYLALYKDQGPCTCTRTWAQGPSAQGGACSDHFSRPNTNTFPGPIPRTWARNLDQEPSEQLAATSKYTTASQSAFQHTTASQTLQEAFHTHNVAQVRVEKLRFSTRTCAATARPKRLRLLGLTSIALRCSFAAPKRNATSSSRGNASLRNLGPSGL